MIAGLFAWCLACLTLVVPGGTVAREPGYPDRSQGMTGGKPAPQVRRYTSPGQRPGFDNPRMFRGLKARPISPNLSQSPTGAPTPINRAFSLHDPGYLEPRPLAWAGMTPHLRRSRYLMRSPKTMLAPAGMTRDEPKADANALARPGVSASRERWPLWEAYASSFLNQEGRVVDPQGGDRTTSEGQSYGLFFALVANDRPRFDLLLHWTAANLADGDLGARLPGWLWGKQPSGEWTILDRHSAADADVWIAYTLCEAGRLWREPAYARLGHRLLNLIASGEVTELPRFGTMLLPGNTGFHPSPDTWILNPSYLPLPVLRGLSNIDPKGPWARIVDRLPGLLKQSARGGFAMDWLRYRAQDGFEPSTLPGDSAAAGGSYDAIRVYLWAGLAHPETPGASQGLNAITGMAHYLAAHNVPPERVDNTGMVVSAEAPGGFSAALLPYLSALGAQAPLNAQAGRVTAHLDAATHLCCRPVTYYDENLTLFGLGSRDHLFAFNRDGQLLMRW